jgi:predicted Zn-dependent protease
MKKALTLFFIYLLFFIQAVFPQPQSQGRSNPRTNNSPDSVNEAFSGMDRAFAEIEDPSLEDAYYLGRAAAASILAAYKPYNEKPELTLYLNKICQAILINSPQIELFNGCHVLILDTQEYNAFSTPGGHIFLTRGFVEAAGSEDMLAAVIAHELAHIMLKHGINIIKEMSFIDDAAATANRASDLTRSNSAARLMSFRNSVSTMFDTIVKNGYSQPQELEADREAIILLVVAGYDPQALLEVFRVLQKMENAQSGGFFSTHPSAGERIANVERWIAGRQVRDTSSYRESRFMNK